MPPELLNTITTGDARELSAQIPDDSIDLIFTDPPYDKGSLELYTWLGREAPRILKPGGFILAYTGNAWKHYTMQRLHTLRMRYFWDYVTIDSGKATYVWNRRTVAKSKSILAYVRGEGYPRTPVLGVWEGGGGDKRFHSWGQDEQTARYFIDCFSAPGNVIFDPFAGGGTTPAMCKVLGRDYIAFEIDPDTAERARLRVAQTQMPLPGIVFQQEEMEV